MKHIRFKKCLIIVPVMVGALLLAEAAFAEEKGFLVKLWERWEKYQESRKKKSPDAEERSPSGVQEPDGDVIVAKKSVIAKITGLAREYPELLKTVPGFSYKKGWDGRMEYYYAPPGDVALKLKECDKDTLVSLLGLLNDGINDLKEKKMSPPAREEVKEEKPAPVKKRKKVEKRKKKEDEDIDKKLDELLKEEPAEEPMEEPDEEKKEGKPEIPFTNEEMIDILKKRLNTFSEIVYIIPDLFVEEGPEGEKVYYYDTPETGRMELEELDKDTLHGLFSRANNEATRINSQRIMRQIQQQEQIIRSIQMPPQQPVNPPQPPKIYVPPQPPKQPAPPPPQPTPPPRQPTPPPKPPRT